MPTTWSRDEVLQRLLDRRADLARMVVERMQEYPLQASIQIRQDALGAVHVDIDPLIAAIRQLTLNTVSEALVAFIDVLFPEQEST